MYENYIVYNTIGRIVRYGACPAEAVEYQAVTDGNFVLSATCTDDRLQYVDITTNPVTIANKPFIPYTIDKTTITANGIDVATISNLPTDSIALVNNESENEANGLFVFGVDLAGVYSINVSHPLYLDTEIVVTAV